MGPMDWKTAEHKFFMNQGREVNWREKTKWDFQSWGSPMSIASCWSYRGKIWKKYAGAYPYPDDIGLEPGHPFFNPDLVDRSEVIDRTGKVVKTEYRHHGRLLRPTDKLYPKDA